ncbi:MAG TPA: DUF72 domain-containing protein [Burkholderiaceae bacterium]|nr:DUF72 domain-containing protein [Burkholderiaceae bacterium]
MRSRRGHIRIGISGWRYPPWRGVFYPAGLAQRRELEYASRCFASVEINGTFYSMQRPEYFHQWHAETPPGFVFALKGSRFITHMLKLRNHEAALANFFASGVLALNEKLGPILWQLPPQLSFDAERVDSFLNTLPRDTAQALAVARGHDARVAGRDWLEIDAVRPMRHALEVRHPSFGTPEFIALLRRHRVALVVADTAGTWPCIEDTTADFIYVRLHGDTELYASGYTDEALDRWARRLDAWARGGQPPDARTSGPAPPPGAPRDVYCYFDNDAKVRAPFDARALMQRLGVPMAPELPAQRSRKLRSSAITSSL